MHRGMFAQLLMGVCLAARAGAQSTATQPDTVKPAARAWMSGFSLGLPGSSEGAIPQLFTVGASFTQVRPNHLGGDVSIGTMPYVAAYGLIPIGVRVGLALPVNPVPHVLLIPTGGVSFIGAWSPGGGGALAGVNAGGSAVFYTGQIGMKTSLTLHHFADTHEAVWLFEWGFVSVPAGLP